jgi:hypothetical protein
MPPIKSRPQLITAAERRAYVLEQRKGGSSYREIAAAARNRFDTPGVLPKGYDERYAHDDVMAELKRLNAQNAEAASEIRTMELARLDRMQTALWGTVLAGSESAIDRVLRIMQRRADLLGLDAPKNLDVKSGGEKLQVVVYLPDNKRDKSD